MREVNKSELAKHIGKSNAIITRLKNEGTLYGCFTPSGKIDLDKAIDNIQKYKGEDYIQFPKMVITPDLKTINMLSGFNLTEKELDMFRVDFTPEMFDMSKLDKDELKEFVEWLPEVITMNMILRDFCNCYGQALFPYAFDFAIDSDSIEDCFDVKYISKV